MKNKLLIGGILGAVILVIMGAIMMSYNAQQREQELNQSPPAASL